MEKPRYKLHWPGGELVLDRVHVMGILNVTSDSFSDGGAFLEHSKAVARALQIVEEGADILDIGAESTRPGAEPISLDEERRRVFPILEELERRKLPIPISLDCRKPDIVAEVLDRRWVQIVNDVEGLRNPEMVEVVKKFKAPVILMHMFGDPQTMQSEYAYEDVVTDLILFFRKRLAEAGLEENVVLDPGIGFGKSADHNLEILRRLAEFKAIGFPVLIGASRKSFIGKILNVEVGERLEGSLAAAAVAVQNGASILRVHDVRATVRFVRMLQAMAPRLL
jgi:dihydropteroate synthase